MKKSKIISTFIYCRDGDLTKITRRILDSLKENTNFPNPIPTLADVEKILQDYVGSLSDAGGFDRVLVSIKEDKKAILKQMLTELAYYVTQTSKGDKTLLLSSGFDINVERGNPQKTPPKLQAELGMPGQVTTRVNRVTKARAYVHQFTADPLTPQSVWISETTLKPAYTFTGITSGAKVWLRVIVIDQYGNTIYWDPVLRIVQ